MPLEKGSIEEIVLRNIATEINAGKSQAQAQAVAIALHTADDSVPAKIVKDGSLHNMAEIRNLYSSEGT